MSDLKTEKQISKREKVAQEILTTERTYVNNLQILVNEYLNELKNSAKTNHPIVSNKDVGIIFSNITDILNVNLELLAHFESRIQNWDDSVILGDFFVKLIPFLKMYTDYIQNYSKANDLLQKYSKTPRFIQWSQRKQTEQSQNLSLSSLLITPVQRLPRYQLLLQELVKATDKSHPDYENLINAQQKINKVNNEINDSIKHKENLDKIVEIQLKFSSKELNDLVASHRRFVLQAEFDQKVQNKFYKRIFFLFNDLLIFAELSGENYKLYGKIPLEKCSIQNLPDSELVNPFIIRYDEKQINLIAKTKEEKENWINIMKKTIQEYKRKSQTLLTSKDSTEKLEWIPNEQARQCYVCDSLFTAWKRKHHCRKCGQVVCHSCSSHKVMLPNQSSTKPSRICDICYKKYKEEENSENSWVFVESLKETQEKLTSKENKEKEELIFSPPKKLRKSIRSGRVSFGLSKQIQKSEKQKIQVIPQFTPKTKTQTITPRKALTSPRLTPRKSTDLRFVSISNQNLNLNQSNFTVSQKLTPRSRNYIRSSLAKENRNIKQRDIFQLMNFN